MGFSHRRLAPIGLLAASLLLVGAAPSASAPRSSAPGGRHGFSDVAHWQQVFDDPARAAWQKPLLVVDFLSVNRGSTVADIGAGTGYFTLYLATVVGDRGRVYAVDIEPAMLEHLKQREDINQKVVTPILAEANDPKLPAAELDLILVVDTWHHIKKRARYLTKLEQSLRPDGRVAIIDYHAGELPLGPPPREKLGRDEVVREFERAGWELAAESTGLPYQYFLTFYPPKRPRAPAGDATPPAPS